MRQAARDRGLTISGSARMINDDDYEKADMIITMDDFNFSEVNKLAPDSAYKKKIRPFCDFVSTGDREVPDPYYGGPSGFENDLLDLMEDGCVRILEHLQKILLNKGLVFL